jgi:hypothetical protein
MVDATGSPAGGSYGIPSAPSSSGIHYQRQVGGLLSPKNAIDVAGCKAILIEKTCPLGEQAAVLYGKTLIIDRWQFVSRRKSNDQVAMYHYQ